jgi:UDP-N-acetylmuramate dehydrogenase
MKQLLYGAGISLTALSYECGNKGLTGLEFAYGIPGKIGGAVRMNAGAHNGQMQDIVNAVKYINFDGEICTLQKDKLKFDYRKSIFSEENIGIILEAELKLEYGDKNEILEKMQTYSKYRKEKQPINYPNAGSTFKRGKDFITAQLIDECGLKGYQIGGAKISELHSGFIINTGNATAKDVLNLIEYTRKKVYEKFEKEIELEVEIIGEL